MKKRKANSPIKPTNPTTNPNTINTNQKAELKELANQLTNIGENYPKTYKTFYWPPLSS